MSASSRLQYPRDSVYQEFTDYVKFTFFQYKPPFDKDYQTSTSSSTTGQQGLDLYNSTSVNLETISIGNFNEILMYMPEDIQAQYTADWGDKSFTNTTRDVLNAVADARVGDGVLGATVQGLMNATGRGPSLIAQQIANQINGLPGGIGGNVSINDVLGGTSGIVLNPNVELLFNAFGMRGFTLNFKMTPRNDTEAKDIRNIITCFKKASLPTYGAEPQLFEKASKRFSSIFTSQDVADAQSGTADTSSNNTNYIGIPKLCGVSFMKGSELHPFLPKYKACAIQDVSVNYTPDGSYATYKDGSPVATTLSLTFAETKLVYANEITFDGASY